MFNYKLTIEYNGQDFFGSQIQEGLRTVQGELDKVLKELLNEDIKTVFSGRTDKGVHAIGQVVNFKTTKDFSHDFSKTLLMINSQLPEDLVVTKIESVTENFNSRFDAKSREYLYKLFIRRQRPVLRTDSLAWFKEDLNFELMQEHCKTFVGKKDFAQYAKEENFEISEKIKDIEFEKTTICEVFEAELIKESKICYKFRIKADRFLRNMVRRMVGELVHIGKGHLVAENSTKFTVPASGLTLMKVEY